MLSVRVMLEMRRAGIVPNTITYGYYNKVLLNWEQEVGWQCVPGPVCRGYSDSCCCPHPLEIRLAILPGPVAVVILGATLLPLHRQRVFVCLFLFFQS